MVRCAAPGLVTGLYETAGLHEVTEHDVDVELVTASPQEYWQMISEHVSLAAAALQQVDEPVRQRIAGAVVEALGPYRVGDEVRVPGLARCVVGTR